MSQSVTQEIGMDADVFGARLRELRTERGWTQAKLAELSGLEANSIARLERGERKPSWAVVVALAEALGVTPNEFLERPAKRPSAGRGRPPKSGAKGKRKKGDRGGDSAR